MADEMPEFKPEPLEVWSSVILTGLLIVVALYSSWVAAILGPDAAFSLTHGISSSWAAFLGVQISILTAVLAWRGFGLNAIAGLFAGTSLSTALIDPGLWKPSVATILAASVLTVAVHFGRRWFEHNPFIAFVSLWGITFVSSLVQSVLFRLLVDNSYPLLGV